MMRLMLASLLLPLCCVAAAKAQTLAPMPLQTLSVSRTHVAFAYAGDIWIVERAGGEARRLETGTGAGRRSDPVFSPDGSQIAFTKEMGGGNFDVFVVPSAGGEARRLTFHPKFDVPVGWTPDGRNLLLRSFRGSDIFPYRLYTIPAQGGFETPLPFPRAVTGSFSPDGGTIAYMPARGFGDSWRNYRGGQTSPVWIARLADSSVEELPRNNSNDSFPMWVGDTIYFVSDRTMTANLFAFDTRTKRVAQLTRFEKYDIRAASAGGDAIAFVQGGVIHLYDLKTNQERALDIRLRGELPETRSRTVKAERWIDNYGVSPTGDRIVIEARGELLSMNADGGAARNLTSTSGVAERSPVFSPDGKSLAYFSDESGEYQLHVRPTGGSGGGGNSGGGGAVAVKKINIEPKPSFYVDPVWSPDSKRIAFTDKRLALWYADLDAGTTRRVDSSTFAHQGSFQPAWSLDGRWLAYAKTLPSRLSAIFLYSVETGQSLQLSDGRLDAGNPIFDRNGQYLYFHASTNAGASKLRDVSMSSAMAQPATTRRIYVVVLQKDGRSPAAPLKDWETGVRDARPRQIDTENISARVMPLPFPAHNFADLLAGKPGVLFILGKWVDTSGGESPATRTLYKFDLAARKHEKFAEDVQAFWLSEDGNRLLYLRPGGAVSLVSTDSPPKRDEGKLDISGVEIQVDPRAEWRQMFDEAWRIERDFFYEPNLHGQNLRALKVRYAAYLPQVASRSDLNVLFREMLSHLAISHMVVDGGDTPAPPEPSGRGTGLLGADYRIEGGRYRISHIFRGDNSTQLLMSPLTQPGVDVREGDFLLAVDGEEIKSSENLYKYFEGKAGRPVQIKVGQDASGAGARTYSVVTLPGENTLRDFEWIEGNRRKVRELSGDRLAYIFLPDVGRPGYDIFNRDFFAQMDKQGLIVDERYNRGGYAADYIIDALRRTPLSAYAFREGDVIPFPTAILPAPRVMLISEFAGSGGDTLPWMFRQAALGTLVGKRTAGAGIGGFVDIPNLLDGGFVTAPNRAFFNPQKGTLEIENYGTPPDIEISWMPADWRRGRDPQLERAVQIALDQLKKSPPTRPKTLQYPIR